MNKFILILFISISCFSFGQIKQKMADNHFSRMEYSKCVEMYNELANQCLKEKKKANWENVRKAAISNYYIYNMDDAIRYYDLLKNKNLLTESDRVLYIEALRYQEQYGKCNEVVRESSNLFPQNNFFSTVYNNKDTFNKLFEDSSFYKIEEASVNSGKGDFGVAYLGNSITYVSKSKNIGFINGRYGWDDDFFLNIMQADFDADSNLIDARILKHNFVSRAHDGPVSFTPEGNEMVITKNELGKKNGKDIVHLALYFSSKANGEWGELIPFEFNNTSYDVGHAVYANGGETLYFSSNKPGGLGEADIYRCKRLGKGWGEPQNLGSLINSSRNDLFPFVQNNTLYFASEGHYGLGGLDIFEVDINGNNSPRNIGYPVNTSHDDFGLIFDDSETIGFLSSNRQKDNVDRIYHVDKKSIVIDLDLSVFAQYAQNEPIENQLVYIMNTTSQELDSILTDSNGKCNTLLRVNQKYQVYTRKDDFILLEEAKLTTEGIKSNKTLTCELILKPTTIKVHLRVVEKENKKIIPMATTTVTDYNTGWDTTMITNENGLVTLTVDRNKVYWAHGSKKGFIDTDISFNSSNENDKVIDLELQLPPIKIGEKFKLENIFYDLNKSSLRSESMASLDKLADFIVKNDLRIELSAHTDSRGSNSYNQKLSQARAQSCVNYLIEKGVNKNSIKAKGYGESQLVNRCKNGVSCSEEEHQENRRTEVKILGIK